VSKREAWLSAVGVFVLAVIVRAVAAASVSFPIPEDTAYYAGVARNLIEGRGLISDALWSYQTQPLVVPRAAFEVWMPLPSLLAAVPMWFAGAANWFRAAQVVSVASGGVVAALAWRLGADVATEMDLPVARARTVALGSGIAASFLGPLVVYGAFPDSTGIFAALSLAACLLMTRIAAHPAGPRDRRLIALGLLLGLAALTRSEAVWLGLAWAVVVWRWRPTEEARGNVAANAVDSRNGRPTRLALVLVPAAVAALVYAPWAFRDWLAFGSPMPGQTLSNAFSVNSFDIFAYQDQPSLAHYLAQGPAALVAMRLVALAHDLFDVLVIPTFPIGAIGLLALPWTGRLSALRPLALTATFTFLVTSFVFPVSTLSGTFLHAAGSIYVLLTVGCLIALDALIVRIGRIRRWTRPVAWLGPAFAVAVSIPLLAVSIGEVHQHSSDIQARYEALPAALARAGLPVEDDAPIIASNPIWLAETAHVATLALPEESPEAVLALAHRFGAKILVVTIETDTAETDSQWPGVLDEGGPDASCFVTVPLTDNSGRTPEDGSPLAQIRVFRVICP
jgi:hypothetical protein